MTPDERRGYLQGFLGALDAVRDDLHPQRLAGLAEWTERRLRIWAYCITDHAEPPRPIRPPSPSRPKSNPTE